MSISTSKERCVKRCSSRPILVAALNKWSNRIQEAIDLSSRQGGSRFLAPTKIGVVEAIDASLQAKVR